MFWGWGGEDDDLYNRVVNTGFNIFSSTSGRFLSTCHVRDKTNLNNNVNTLMNSSRTQDGLTNLRHIAKDITTTIHYNELHVSVNINTTNCKIALTSGTNNMSSVYAEFMEKIKKTLIANENLYKDKNPFLNMYSNAYDRKKIYQQSKKYKSLFDK